MRKARKETIKVMLRLYLNQRRIEGERRRVGKGKKDGE